MHAVHLSSLPLALGRRERVCVHFRRRFPYPLYPPALSLYLFRLSVSIPIYTRTYTHLHLQPKLVIGHGKWIRINRIPEQRRSSGARAGERKPAALARCCRCVCVCAIGREMRVNDSRLHARASVCRPLALVHAAWQRQSLRRPLTSNISTRSALVYASGMLWLWVRV